MTTTRHLSIAVTAMLALFGAVTLFGSLPVQRAHAASITVTKTADTNDGTCDSDCSLREAVIAANATVGVHDNIQIPNGTYNLTIAGAGENASATGDLDVTDSVSFNGSGMTTTIINGPVDDNVIEALDSSEVLIVTDLTLQEAGGAGIFADFAEIQIANVLIRGNGDIGIDTLGDVSVQSSVIDDNDFGGIWGEDGDIVVTRSTVSRNNGRGIQTSAGNITLTNSTVSNNNDDGIFTDDGDITLNWSTVADSDGNGVDASESGLIFLYGSIVADNDSDDCGTSVEASNHSLDTDGSCGLSGTGDISEGFPDLGPLQNNGGTTETRELLAESNAIDAGGTSCPEDDQRGEERYGGDGCDIGAYEGVEGEPDPTATPREGGSNGPQNTPTGTSTPAATNTPHQPEATSTTAPPTGSGGAGGVIQAPDTGSGGSGGNAGVASRGFLWAALALLLGGSAMVSVDLIRRRG